MARSLVRVVMAVGVTLVLTGCGSAPGSAGRDEMLGSPTSAASAAPSTAEPSPAGPAGAARGTYLEYSEEAFEAATGERVLFFHAPWCPQCRALDADLRKRGTPDGMTIFRVDYDSETALRRAHDVRIQTTVVWVDQEGTTTKSVVLYDEPSVDALAAARP